VIEIRRLEPKELERIGEIDRTEHVTQAYVCIEGSLQRQDVEWRIPPWAKAGRGDHSVQGNIEAWRLYLDRGGSLLGALDGPRLVGFAIYLPRLTETMAQFAVLYVSSGRRGQGIGSRLTEEVIALARADGADDLYVSATPSAPTVDFYRAHGFEVTPDPYPELLELEPEDIHMVLRLT
jgi:ribosomal protein S18 acetylase RimI-like enzyme